MPRSAGAWPSASRPKGSQNHIFLGDEDVSRAIRSPEMDMGASRVSAVKEVREAMTAMQRNIAAGLKVIAEGRDMGTVVFPGGQLTSSF